jgi:hypothetical protein
MVNNPAPYTGYPEDCFFLQSLETNSRAVPQVRPRPFPSTSIPICYSVTNFTMGRKTWVSGFNSWQRQEISLFSLASNHGSGLTRPSIQWLLGIYPRQYNGRHMKLTTHIRLVEELYLHSPLRLHGVVVNYVSKWKALTTPFDSMGPIARAVNVIK